MTGLTFKLIGADKLAKKLTDKDTIGKPVASGIKKIALKYAGMVKKATVWKTGELRSSITQEIGATSARVGTQVQYAPFVEWGTSRMEARHMEGGTKRLGQGMFGFALGLLREWMDKEGHDIHVEIEKRFD